MYIWYCLFKYLIVFISPFEPFGWSLLYCKSICLLSSFKSFGWEPYRLEWVIYNEDYNFHKAIQLIEKILNKPDQPTPKDPALEHIDALAGKPFQAFPGQDHRAHITSHLSFMSTNIAKNNPMIIGSLEKNIFEHISLMALEQVEIEFTTQLQQLQQLSQDPMAAQNPQMQMQVQQLQMQMTQLQQSGQMDPQILQQLNQQVQTLQ